ncbi:MAG TPA: hypothetical protein DDW50_11120, partial [Firmicutes bacterium]|nr:hypothetical protein [Bacillota bacterium]
GTNKAIIKTHKQQINTILSFFILHFLHSFYLSIKIFILFLEITHLPLILRQYILHEFPSTDIENSIFKFN